MRTTALLSITAAAVLGLAPAAAAQPGAGYGRGHAGPPPSAHSARHAPGPRYHDTVRFERGHRIPHFWFGPQFHVQNWQLYGFAQPRGGQRWVRYYDDAYLVDGDGLVMDGRYGLDWDAYGEQWDHEAGVPQYVGTGDFVPGPEDVEWVESQAPHAAPPAYAGRGRYEGHAYPPQGHPYPYGYQSYGHYPYGYGYQGGYGAYHWGTITETITTVTTGGATSTRSHVIEHQPPRQRARHHRAPAPRPCDCPLPLGERG